MLSITLQKSSGNQTVVTEGFDSIDEFKQFVCKRWNIPLDKLIIAVAGSMRRMSAAHQVTDSLLEEHIAKRSDGRTLYAFISYEESVLETIREERDELFKTLKEMNKSAKILETEFSSPILTK